MTHEFQSGLALTILPHDDLPVWMLTLPDGKEYCGPMVKHEALNTEWMGESFWQAICEEYGGALARKERTLSNDLGMLIGKTAPFVGLGAHDLTSGEKLS